MNAYWSKCLPAPIRNRLNGRQGLQAVLRNSSWLFADRILRMSVGLVVGIWVVRYLGPAQLGVLSYVGAFAGLFGSFATLGLDSILIRELVSHPKRQHELMGSAFVMKLIAGVVAMSIAILAIFFVRPNEVDVLTMVAIVSAGYIFQSLNVIDCLFQSKVQSKFTVYATTCAFLVITLMKVALLVTKASLIAFAWVGLAESVLTACFLIISYERNHFSIKSWTFNAIVAKQLLAQSWPLILSGLAIMVYMRIDQIMIGQMLGDKEVGLFAAAARIGEMWYFVPMALASSILPTIVQSKNLGDTVYYARLQKFFTFMIWLAMVLAIIVTLNRHWIVALLLGPEYAKSSTVLSIHIWAGVFVAMGMASSSWFIVEGLQKLSFYKALTGGIVNVGLNFLLIPLYGIEGAAIATVAGQICAVFFFDFFIFKTRRVFWMKVKAFNPFSVAGKIKNI